MHWAYGAIETKDDTGDKGIVIAEIYFDEDNKIMGYTNISYFNLRDNLKQITEDINHQVQERIYFKVEGNKLLMIKRKVSKNARKQ